MTLWIYCASVTQYPKTREYMEIVKKISEARGPPTICGGVVE